MQLFVLKSWPSRDDEKRIVDWPRTMMIVTQNTFAAHGTMRSAIRFQALTNETVTNTCEGETPMGVKRLADRSYFRRNGASTTVTSLVEQDERVSPGARRPFGTRQCFPHRFHWGKTERETVFSPRSPCSSELTRRGGMTGGLKIVRPYDHKNKITKKW